VLCGEAESRSLDKKDAGFELDDSAQRVSQFELWSQIEAVALLDGQASSNSKTGDVNV
jgi:hypothetical protein